MNIYIKTLLGDLYYIDIENIENIENIHENTILERLYFEYPSIFPKKRTQIVQDKQYINLYYTLILPKISKKIVMKKSYIKHDHVILYIGISLFDCTEKIEFYENNDSHKKVDVDIDIFRKQFESIYKKCSIYDMFICNPNKLTIEFDKNKKEYVIFMGNYGEKNIGSVLVEVLSKKFCQIISHTGVLENADCGDEMYPYYKINFFFCDDTIKRLSKMIENEIKYYL